MASLCQRCTGEDNARTEIDISKRGDGGGGPEPALVPSVSGTAAAKPGVTGRAAPPQQKVMGAQEMPMSPKSPASPQERADASKAPNAQVIGGENKGAEPAMPGNFANSPKSVVTAKSKDTVADGDYCLCFPYRHRVEEDEALQSGCWCVYCCCWGIALHRRPSPLQLRSHCTCIEQTWETQEVDGISGGPWACINTCCFATLLCLMPRRLGHPRCICCQEDCCGVVGGYKAAADRSTGEDRGLSAYDHALYEQFVPCYCCCCGVGLAGAYVSLINSFSKCFCCMCRFSTGMPDCDEGELCFNFLNCWCCLFHCRIVPELRKNPICACCGWRWKSWRQRPGDHSRDEYVDSANEIHCDFPLGVYDQDVQDKIPSCPGVTPYRQNPVERWRDVW